MTKSTIRGTFGLVIALLLTGLIARPALAQDWAGRGRLHGIVTDDEGKALEGATVHLYFKGDEKLGPKPLTTDKHGNWTILGLGEGQWMVVIEKEGYVSSQGNVNVSETQVIPSVKVSLRSVEHTEAGQQAKKAKEAQGDFETAVAAFNAGDYARARELFEKVLPQATAESKPSVMMNIAKTYVQEKNFDQALQMFDQVLALQPNNVEAKKDEAAIYDQKGQSDQALTILQQIITANPADTGAIQLAANILIAKGRQDEAKKYLAMLPEGTKVDPDALLNMGIAKYNANDYKEALTYFNQVVEQQPGQAEGYYYRGLAYLASGNAAGAKADFKKFLEIAPNHAKAAEVREYLKSL